MILLGGLHKRPIPHRRKPPAARNLLKRKSNEKYETMVAIAIVAATSVTALVITKKRFF